MKVVINLPDLSAYCDTLLMIGELSKRVQRVYVLTNDGQKWELDQFKQWPKLHLIAIPRHQYSTSASHWITQRVKAEGLDVIHDMFGHFAPFCEQRHPHSRSYIMLTTQRTTNWGWFKRVKPLKYMIDLRYASQRVLSLWKDTRILRSVDHVVVLGPGHEEDIIQAHGLSPSSISYIPSETDISLFHPPSSA